MASSLHGLQLIRHDLCNPLPILHHHVLCSAGIPLSSSCKWPARKPTAMVRGAAQFANAAPAEADRKQGPSNKTCPPLQLTYLEGNSWLWNLLGMQVLVDPVLVGNLDFGIPWLYDASKKIMRKFKLEELPELDLLLIAQDFDDHCHQKTLTPLSKMFPNLQVVATPNAESILSKLFQKVIYLEPGQSTVFRGKNGSEIGIRASAGPILGPPWQRPENGYFIEAKNPEFILYYEPHCIFDRSQMKDEKADVVITPMIKQVLPLYTLVEGKEDAVELVKLLQARFVVPLQNGDLDAKGLLSKLVKTVGTVEEFRELMQKDLPHVQVLEPEVGVPLEVPVAS